MIEAVYINNRLADGAILNCEKWERPYPNGVNFGGKNYPVIGVGTQLWTDKNIDIAVPLEYEPTFTEGKYIKTNIGIGGYVDTTPVANSGYKYTMFNCYPGDRIRVMAHGGSSPRAVAFTDINGNLLYKSDSGAEVIGEITVPDGARKCIVNNNNTVISNPVCVTTRNNSTTLGSTSLYYLGRSPKTRVNSNTSANCEINATGDTECYAILSDWETGEYASSASYNDRRKSHMSAGVRLHANLTFSEPLVAEQEIRYFIKAWEYTRGEFETVVEKIPAGTTAYTVNKQLLAANTVGDLDTGIFMLRAIQNESNAGINAMFTDIVVQYGTNYISTTQTVPQALASEEKYKSEGYGMLYDWHTLCAGSNQMTDSLEEVLGIGGMWIYSRVQAWQTVAYPIKADHRYKVCKCKLTGGTKDGTTTMCSASAPDAGPVGNRVEIFTTTGISNGEYFEFTATRDAPYFGVYCGGSGCVKITDVTGAWRIPAESDFTTLTGISGRTAAEQATNLKSGVGWIGGGGNGIDKFGFSVLANGYWNAGFTDSGAAARIFTSTLSEGNIKSAYVTNQVSFVGTNSTVYRGFRLVKDIGDSTSSPELTLTTMMLGSPASDEPEVE